MSAADGTGVDIRIVGGAPDEEEIAAVTAVLSAALERVAADLGQQSTTSMSRWEQTGRNLRRPLVRGAWRPAGR